MMHIDTLTTPAGMRLRYAHCSSSPSRPWITLVIPFGLDVEMARPFFDFFQSHYNVCTWESRSILEESARECAVAEFSVDCHAADLLAVLHALGIDETILVGYCSGAGIALTAINLAPNRFTELVLVHGEYTMLGDAKCMTPFAMDMDTLLCLAADNDTRARLVYDKIREERFEGDANRPTGLDKPFSDIRFLKRYAQNYLAYKSADFKQLAAEITHPTLVMAGGKDIQVNINSSQTIHGCMRNAALFVDPEADHYGLLTQDSHTLIAVWNFLCENAHARHHRPVHSRNF
jgi:pimeloyl-ACP methyl ester carboxylesterase